MSRRLYWFVPVILMALPLSALAEEPAPVTAPPVPTEAKPEQPVVPEKKPERPAPSERVPRPVLSCPKAIIPVYVDTWGRLAALTESDPEVAPVSKFWSSRRDSTSTVLATGTIIGSGAILLGTVNRLTNDSWTTANQWEIAGGAGVILASVLTWWLFSPDRDDFLTVINHWNLRHEDRPLAP
jgi:hypothetical protein